MRLRDEWETPADVFRGISRALGPFDIDVCAMAHNAKCLHYITPEQNGLVLPWNIATCWLNPPYSNIGPWLEKAIRHVENSHAGVVALVPADPSVGWWAKYVANAPCQAYLVTGRRIQFIPPQRIKATSNTHASAIIHYFYGADVRKVKYWMYEDMIAGRMPQ